MAMDQSHELPPLIEGMVDKEGLVELFTSLSATSKFGYDPNTDYRKQPSRCSFADIFFLRIAYSDIITCS
jgi:hypothetical protein